MQIPRYSLRRPGFPHSLNCCNYRMHNFRYSSRRRTNKDSLHGCYIRLQSAEMSEKNNPSSFRSRKDKNRNIRHFSARRSPLCCHPYFRTYHTRLPPRRRYFCRSPRTFPYGKYAHRQARPYNCRRMHSRSHRRHGAYIPAKCRWVPQRCRYIRAAAFRSSPRAPENSPDRHKYRRRRLYSSPPAGCTPFPSYGLSSAFYRPYM